MARYSKDFEGERRTRRRVVMLTPTEDQQIETSAKKVGAQFSEHFRELALRRSSSAAVVAGTTRNPETRELMRELTAIGNNLNQLAKRANTTGNLPARIELNSTTSLLKQVFQRVLEL